jgi:hypothetical membrane protein
MEGFMADTPDGRYATIRNYTLLVLGSIAFLAGVASAVLGNPYGVAIASLGGAALGLIPVFEKRDKA